MPDTSFMSVGSSDDVEHDRLQLSDRITALVDGLRVLRHRNLECYLLADDVLEALCTQCGHPEKAEALKLARDEAMAYAVEERAVPVDDFKMARNETVTAARRLFSDTQGGNNTDRS